MKLFIQKRLSSMMIMGLAKYLDIFYISKDNKIKIYIDGVDMQGWSLASDRSLLLKLINKEKFKIINNWKKADIIHNVWWENNIFNKPCVEKKENQKIILTCADFVDYSMPEFNQQKFDKLTKLADVWICPSFKQKKLLDNLGLKTFYFPFSVNLDKFKPNSEISKKEICEKIGINYNSIENKFVIGSFQRDSLGKDLTKPKWQKNPDLLIELIKDLPKNKFVLLLAGPRRHYIISQCKKADIPYIYIGKETNKDDININTINIENMNLLYWLSNIYLITSKSEGGPKAAIEATATKTFIMSTDVGLCSDFIDNRFVYADNEKFKNNLKNIILNYDSYSEIIAISVENNYLNCLDIVNEGNLKNILNDLYSSVISQ